MPVSPAREISAEPRPALVAPLERRAARVSFVTGLSTLLAVGLQMISVPVCIHYWGKETYGTWLALFSAFMLLRSLDGGYVIYVGNELNCLYHRNAEALREHLASAIIGIVIIGVLQMSLAAGTLIFSALSILLGVSAGHSADATARLGLVTLMLSWVLTGSYLGLVHRLLIPAGLMHRAAWWAMGFQVCQFAAIMVSAVLRLTMLQTSGLFAASQVLIYAGSALYVRRVMPAFSPWLHRVNARVGLRDLRRSLSVAASTMLQQGVVNGAVLLISASVGPVAVPVFTTVRTLTNLWVTVTTVLSSPLLPEVVRIHAAGEARKLAALNRVYWVVVGTLVNLGALLSYPLIPALYGQWTAHAVHLDLPLLCLLLGSVVVANSAALMALHLNGINSLRIVLTSSIVRAVLALGGGAIGLRYHGLMGLGVAIVCGEIAAALMIARHFLKYEASVEGEPISAGEFGPVLLSTGSALLFFIGAGLGWRSYGLPWPAAIAGVVLAASWGWKKMEPELQVRVQAMLSSRVWRHRAVTSC